MWHDVALLSSSRPRICLSGGLLSYCPYDMYLAFAGSNVLFRVSVKQTMKNVLATSAETRFMCSWQALTVRSHSCRVSAPGFFDWHQQSGLPIIVRACVCAWSSDIQSSRSLSKSARLAPSDFPMQASCRSKCTALAPRVKS